MEEKDYDTFKKELMKKSSLVLGSGSDEDFIMKVPSYSTNEVQKTRIVASLVPDEIIYSMYGAEKQLLFTGVIFLADISGFTDLTEKYSSVGKGGPSKLTQVLNNYIGAMVQEIMSLNGDVLKFSGDAFLALWKSSETVPMTEAVHAAIDCALNIQKSHGLLKTEIGITLKVKIAISAGQLMRSLIGTGHFLLIGDTVWDVKSSEHLCNAGEIIISSAVINYMRKNEWNMVMMKDGIHYKVLGIGPEWSAVQYTIQADKFGNEIEDILEDEPILLESTNNEMRYIFSTEDVNVPLHDYTLRPSIDFAVRKNMIEFLKNYTLLPVVRIIETNEPLEYFTEMRQVVVLFVNVVTKSLQMNVLIDVAEEINATVHRCANTYEGCVNKISMFDKDLMFLLLFGLRGFKHELETQMGLRCAREIYFTLESVEEIISVSVGVTSGMTYCGVVGHPLRREYTVIGRTVNKAARLMIAYPGQVTCDRQTFLNSKLNPTYFVLQEYRPLKGFKSVGPLYSFEEPAETDLAPVQEELPQIFGREKELNDFNSFLQDYLDRKEAGETEGVNTLAITGYSRQGKTYLLNKTLDNAKYYVSIHRFTQTSYERKESYSTIRNLFYSKLKIVEGITMEQKTHRVAYCLRNIRVPQFLCALNEILNLNFEITDYYAELSPRQKYEVQEKMIKYLCRELFPQDWLIAIDSSEHIDDQSWRMINHIINLDIVVLILVVGSIWKPCYHCENTLANPRILKLPLGEIDRWWHSALICQMLEVEAIPLTLEKHIQDNSNGNPGWIQNYLQTLQQAGIIYKQAASKLFVYDQGYVIPTLHMIRFSFSSIPSFNVSFTTYSDNTDARWDLYKYSYKESFTDLEKIRLFKSQSDKILVCKLNKTVTLGEKKENFTGDGQLMQLYDTLRLKEQMLIKACTVLGDQFSRKLVNFLFPQLDPFEFATRIQVLFEMKILCCYKAIYENGYTKLIHSKVDPELNDEIECNCEGFPIEESCKNLPKYANCGYMRFRNTKFREMIYGLLTDSQMKEYHTRAIWFAENETKRCRACGGGYFYGMNQFLDLSNYFDDGMRKYFDTARAENVIHLSNIKTSLKGYSIRDLEKSDYQLIHRRQTMFDRFLRKINRDNLSKASLVERTKRRSLRLNQEKSRDVLAEQSYYDLSKIKSKSDNRFLKIFSKKVIKFPKVRKFSTRHLPNCECRLILTTMFSHLMIHYQETEKKEKYLNLLLEYAALSVTMSNTCNSFELLFTATQLLNELEPTFTDPDWQVPIYKGRIQTIYGHLHYVRGKYDDAETAILKAIKFFGLEFPQKKYAVRIKTIRTELQLRRLLKNMGKKSKHADLDDCTLYNNTSIAFSHLCNIYKVRESWKKTYLAAAWSLEQALKADVNFNIICQAFAQLAESSHYVGKSHREEFFNHAFTFCFRKETKLEIHELESLIKLYAALLFIRIRHGYSHIQGELIKHLLDMPTSLYISFFKWQFVPTLHYLLVLSLRLADAVSLIHSTKFLLNDESNVLGPMLYYSSCIVMRLETGYCIEQFSKCEKYFKGNKQMRSPETETEYRFYSALWLWYVRTQNWESADLLYTYLGDFFLTSKKYNPLRIISDILLLEGHLLLYVTKLDDNDHIWIAKMKNVIISLFERMTAHMMKFNSSSITRLIHLEAYWAIIQDKQAQAASLLDQAEILADSKNNNLEKLYIRESRSSWMKLETPSTGRLSWAFLSTFDHFVDWTREDIVDTISLFQLPMPKCYSQSRQSMMPRLIKKLSGDVEDDRPRVVRLSEGEGTKPFN